MRKIIYIPHSIAFTSQDGVIYLNKHLKTFDKSLYKRILEHEKAHAMGLYNAKDFALDFNSGISQWELLGFCLHYPSGFVQMCPVVKVKDIYFYSWLSALKLVLLGGFVWLMIKMF